MTDSKSKDVLKDDLQRLAAFESALAEMQEQFASASKSLEELRAQNKTKTATYRQLTARKLALKSSLAFFEARGLI